MTSTTFLVMVYAVNWITTGFIAGVAFYPSVHPSSMRFIAPLFRDVLSSR